MESLFVMAQVAPTEYPKDNLEKADSLVKEAAEKYHPGMIIFPETFMSRFPAGTDIATANAVAEPLDGEFVQGMKKLAADHDVWLTFGMKETIEDPADHRSYNTDEMVNNKGERRFKESSVPYTDYLQSTGKHIFRICVRSVRRHSDG